MDELHEEVDVLGVDFLAEVVDGLVHVLRQRVPLLPPDVVPLAPDTLHVLPRRRRRHRLRVRRGGARARAEAKAMGVKTFDRWRDGDLVGAAMEGFVGGLQGLPLRLPPALQNCKTLPLPVFIYS